MIVGVDDAGRGAIIGPLVIAGVRIDARKEPALSEIGVKDSKLLSPFARSNLYPKIVELSEKVYFLRVSPAEVDEYVLKGKKLRKLNYLEALTMAKVIEELKPKVAYVDASDVDPERFRQDIRGALSSTIEIVSSHKAESLYPVVAAASIIAKVERDAAVAELRSKYGDFGSGYPADRRTVSFLMEWLGSKGDIPPFARRSWKTWASIRALTLDRY